MTRLAFFTLVLLLLAAASFPAPCRAQGRTDYFNVESPQVHPIEVARVDGHDFLLVCNTPESSVEIWDTDETLPLADRLLRRVRVGLEPVSVRWHAGLGRFYAAGFLGDSVTVVALSAPTGPASLTVNVERTAYVGDEPTDVAFFALDDGGEIRQTLFVTHMMQDGYGWLDALTLEEINPGTRLLDAVVDSGQDLDGDGALDTTAVKQPRALAVACGRLFLLGTRGGTLIDGIPTFDLDLFIADTDLFTADTAASLPSTDTRYLGGLGTTNLNFRFAADGALWAVGGEAQSSRLDGEAAVAAAETGFVESFVYRVSDPCGDDPTVERRDVNLAPEPVSKAQALAQLTDIVAFTPPAGPTRVFFTAFGSDRIGVLEPTGAVESWPLSRIDLRPGGEPTVDTAGPRGLALKEANPAQAGDPGARLYVLNRISHSLIVIDPLAAPASAVLGEVDLNDPTPDYIRDGRRFLYSARFSGRGFSSCASCHIDARTDGLAWDLSEPDRPDEPDQAIPDELLNTRVIATTFPDVKELMVTQSLQGLLNFEVEPESQHLVTNAPYHWRGDRPSLRDFNPAFVSLLEGSAQLTPTQIAQLEEMINSVQYPGNPRQQPTRRLTGVLAGSQGAASTGGTANMVAYHTKGCVLCHSLPEASNNRITERQAADDPHDPTAGPSATCSSLRPLCPQPIETPALRGLILFESRLNRSPSASPEGLPMTGLEGLTHAGFRKDVTSAPNGVNGVSTLAGFLRQAFRGLCPPGERFCSTLQNIAGFIYELDWGVSPLIGYAYTIEASNAESAATDDARALLEEQAQVGNVGIAVQAWIEGEERGFWYDQNEPLALYREEPGPSAFTFAQLKGLLASPVDRLILIATPLGSERRVASPTPGVAVLTGVAPSELELLPMVTNTANADVPLLSEGWTGAFNSQGGAASHSTRLFQYGLIASAPAGSAGFGVGPSPTHDPPRRLRVAGNDIRHGAHLELFTHDDPAQTTPPLLGLPPEHPSQVLTHRLSLPIYPTGALHEGRRVWETAVELEPAIFLKLMLGGPQAPGVEEAVTDYDFSIPEPPVGVTFASEAWNWHYVRVVNADGTSTDGGWQRLLRQPTVSSLVFADGFESRKLSAWTVVSGGS